MARAIAEFQSRQAFIIGCIYVLRATDEATLWPPDAQTPTAKLQPRYKEQISTLCATPSPKEGTPTGPTDQAHVLCMSHVASRRRMLIRSENFAVPLAMPTRESASARGGMAFCLPQRAIDATTQGRQWQGTKAPTPAPLPLPGFPVVNSSSQAERRRPRQPLNVSALTLTAPILDFWSQRKGKEEVR